MTPKERIEALLKRAEELLPSTGELSILRRELEEHSKALLPYIDWQFVQPSDGDDFAGVPRDRPILVLFSWDTAPAIVWWDEAEDCWQFADDALVDSIGIVEEFVGWAEVFDTRFFNAAVARGTEVKGGVA